MESKELVNISDRKKDILNKAIEDYIYDGVPVSSGSLCEKHNLDLSSATVRNELNALEEMGFLKKLHTSGGRVPTTKGYKVFVKTLAGSIPKETKLIKEIRKSFLNHSRYLTEVVKDVAKTVSDITNYPTVVLYTGLKNYKIERIQIVPLMSGQGLVLIETNFGILEPIVLNGVKLSEKVCLEASFCFTKNFKGTTIDDLVSFAKDAEKKISGELKDYAEIFKAVSDLLIAYIKESEKSITIGANNLLEMPEYQNSYDAKKIMDFLEDDNLVKKVLSESSDNEKVEFKLGIKTDDSGQAPDCAIVKTNCKTDGVNLAQIAVIGPERMDYSKIASALLYINKEIEGGISGREKDE